MTIEQALSLINNSDVPKQKRKFAPPHSLTVFNRAGEVVSVARFEARPTEQEQADNLREWPGCVQIFTRPGRFTSVEVCERYIADSMWLFSHLSRSGQP